MSEPETEQEMVAKYKGAIISRAQKYFLKNPRFDIDDLIEEATVAAIKAHRSFDESKGVKKLTFLISSMDLELQKYIWANAHDLHASEWHSRKDREGIAAIKPAVRMDKEPVFQNTSYRFDGEHSSNSVHELTPGSGVVPSPEDVMIQKETLSILHEEIAKLPDNERIVIQNRFFGNKTLVDVAAVLKTTKQTVHGWEKNGLERLGRRLKKRLEE